jgi:ABC-type molybdate transport system substrate-binding protein
MVDKSELPIIPDQRADDLHQLERVNASQLSLFMAGNQFMVMEELIRKFKKEYPEIQRIYYQTLPPGLQLKQILAGTAIFRDRFINIKPDIYTSVNQKAMEKLVECGMISRGSYRLYLHNRLVLMVPAGNPSNILYVTDLGKDQVRISQPDPNNEDIALHIMDMYRDAGGDRLVRRIMEEKRAEGTTIMTIVHHRETPNRLVKGTVDVGPVWATEASHARSKGMPIEVIDPGPELDQRNRVKYYICQFKQAPNPENAAAFLRFMDSNQARFIYEKYGFVI